MKFKVYRNGNYLTTVDINKADGKWQPFDSEVLRKGDVVESIDDGTKLVVDVHVSTQYLHPMLRMSLIQDEPD